MSKLQCNVLKFSGGGNAPNSPPGCAPASEQSRCSASVEHAVLVYIRSM